MLRPERRKALAMPAPPADAAAAATGEPYSMSLSTVVLAGEQKRVDVYRPTAQPIRGVAIIAHGFTRSRGRHRELGIALASAGVAAVIPDLPHVMNLWGNGDALVELADKLEAGALELPPVDRHRLVLIGTSAGGSRASSPPPPARPRRLDRSRSGRSHRHRNRRGREAGSPAVVLLGEPTACNLFASGRSLARAVPKLVAADALPGASHCDFEWPTNRFCEAHLRRCDGADPGPRATRRGARCHPRVLPALPLPAHATLVCQPINDIRRAEAVRGPIIALARREACGRSSRGVPGRDLRAYGGQ
jgi:hypothetical protein